MRQLFAFIAFILALPALLSSPAEAQVGSTWDRIAAQKVMKVGLIPNRPPYQYKSGNDQEGLAIQMGKDLAAAVGKEMKAEIKIDYVQSTWGTIVLDIQAGNIDVFFGMTDSQERRKAISMFGPLYSVPVVALNAQGFAPGDKWADYDKENVTIATILGTTDDEVAKQIIKKAKIKSLRALAEAALDVQSGRSQALFTSLLIGLDASTKAPNTGKLILLQPVQSAPSGGGATRDADGKFATFAQKWSEEYRKSGRVQTVITDAIAKSGLPVDKLPAGVQF